MPWPADRRANSSPVCICTVQFAMADRKSRDNKLDEAEFSAYFAKVGQGPGQALPTWGCCLIRHPALFDFPRSPAAKANRLLKTAASRVFQVTAPKLVDSLAAEAPEELAQLRRSFAAFATFGATRASAGGDSELDGVRAERSES